MIASLNKNKLYEIAHETPASEIIFIALKNRDRTRKVTDLRQFLYKLLNEGKKITKEDVNQKFQQLQDLDIGSLIHGRKGKPTRFKWNYSIKRIGRLGLSSAVSMKNKKLAKHNKSSELIALSKKASSFIPKGIKAAVKSKKVIAYMITEIPLRENVNAKIEIPIDLTKAEAREIASIIKSLVQTEFEESVEPINQVPGLTFVDKVKPVESSSFGIEQQSSNPTKTGIA